MAASHNNFLDKSDKMVLPDSSQGLTHRDSVAGANGAAVTAEEIQELIPRRFNPRFACRMKTRLTKL